jgi:hypothetical protein
MRMYYDQARQNFRINWKAYVVPRDIFGGFAGSVTYYIVGISVYQFDRILGNITEQVDTCDQTKCAHVVARIL